MGSVKKNSPYGFTIHCKETSDGTLCRALSPLPGTSGLGPVRNKVTIDGKNYQLVTRWIDVYATLLQRINNASNIQEVLELSRQVDGLRNYYEHQGVLIKKEAGGDDEVKKSIKDIISGRFTNRFHKILFQSGWEIVDKDIDSGMIEAIKESAELVVKEILKKHVGEFVTQVSSALKSGNIMDAIKAGEYASKGISKEFSDRDGFLRKVVNQLKKKGIIDKQLKYKVTKVLGNFFSTQAKRIEQFIKIFETFPPIIFLKVFLTSSRISSNQGGEYPTSSQFGYINDLLMDKFTKFSDIQIDVPTSMEFNIEIFKNSQMDQPILRMK